MTFRSRYSTSSASVALFAALLVAGCSSLSPQPLEDKAVRERAASDRLKMFDQQEPIDNAIGLDEAIARSLKYNLDLRLKKMEVAVNEQLHEVSKYDMLPNVIAGAGYANRSNYAGGDSRPLFGPRGSRPDDALPRTQNFTTSSDMSRRLASVEFSWNVLDFGVSYFRAKQRADEFLISQERRRRVIQTTVHDVRFAFWRALAAQRLAGEAETIMKQAEQAIEQSRAAEARGAIPVQIALAYQRSLVDAIALLNARRQDLDFAKAELAALMSAPTNGFTIKDEPEPELKPLPANVAILEDTALVNRPELREEDLRRRISADETRRQLLQAFPNLTAGIGRQFDSNSLLYNSNWIEESARVSWSLLRLLAAPQVKEAGERQLEVDDARRQALSMAVMTQMRIATLRYGLARSDLDLAQKSLDVDARVASVARSGVRARAESELELVRATARAAVSKYQRAIAHANAQAAYARIQHSLGQDFDFGDIDASSIAELAGRVGATLAQAEKQLPTALQGVVGPRPKVRLVVDQAGYGSALQSGMVQALNRGGFDVVTADQANALRLQVSLRMGDPRAGLRQSEVLLSERGKSSTVFRTMLPADPKDATLAAVGEAAITANVGNLREWVSTSGK